MRLLRHLHKAPVRVLRLQRRKSMMRIRFGMIRLQCALSQEKAETKQMLRIYQNYVTGQVSKAELQQANSQLADVLRATGLGVFAILPFAPITIPLIVNVSLWREGMRVTGKGEPSTPRNHTDQPHKAKTTNSTCSSASP